MTNLQATDISVLSPEAQKTIKDWLSIQEELEVVKEMYNELAKNEEAIRPHIMEMLKMINNHMIKVDNKIIEIVQKINTRPKYKELLEAVLAKVPVDLAKQLRVLVEDLKEKQKTIQETIAVKTVESIQEGFKDIVNKVLKILQSIWDKIKNFGNSVSRFINYADSILNTTESINVNINTNAKRIKQILRESFLSSKKLEEAKEYIRKWLVSSRTTSGKKYVVSLTKDGEYECSCPVWIFTRKECPHIQAVKKYEAKQPTDLEVTPADMWLKTGISGTTLTEPLKYKNQNK